MKNNLTELVFILDRSGSMAGLESDTIGGFNSMLAKQKKEEGACFVSTVLFDHESEVLHDRLKLEDVRPMGEEDYTVRGTTALLDAVGGAIKHIGNIHKYARPEDVPAHTIFVITTDGMENASHRYTYKKVQAMIKRQQEKYGWEFIFIGANIDAIEEAQRFGIRKERAVNYVHDQMGTETLYSAVSKAVCAVRMADVPSLSSAIDQCEWNGDINSDYMKRGKKWGGRS